MKKNELKEAISILDGPHGEIARAWVAGKEIEYKEIHGSCWNKANGYNGFSFIKDMMYRIKPTTTTGAFYNINSINYPFWVESRDCPEPHWVKVSDYITVEIKDGTEIHRTTGK